MDFNQLEISNEPTLLQFRHPGTNELLWEKPPVLDESGDVVEAGEPVGVYIYSSDSEPYQKLQRQLLDKRLSEAGKKKQSRPTVSEIESNGMATIVACISHFVNVQIDGNEVGDTRALFPIFLSRHKWAREQIDQSIVDRSLFIKGSSTN